MHNMHDVFAWLVRHGYQIDCCIDPTSNAAEVGSKLQSAPGCNAMSMQQDEEVLFVQCDLCMFIPPRCVEASHTMPVEQGLLRSKRSKGWTI